MQYLKDNGLEENTIIVYTSDRDFYLCVHGWFDKRFVYEESFRTPLLVKYPKEISVGTNIDALVKNLDFVPTILVYAGIAAPAQMQVNRSENWQQEKQGNKGAVPLIIWKK